MRLSCRQRVASVSGFLGSRAHSVVELRKWLRQWQKPLQSSFLVSLTKGGTEVPGVTAWNLRMLVYCAASTMEAKNLTPIVSPNQTKIRNGIDHTTTMTAQAIRSDLANSPFIAW